jgi:beta-lactamase class A
MTSSHTPKLDMKGLDSGVAKIAARASPGILGFGLRNLESGEVWVRLGERPFPMQSVFKLLLGAAVLSEVGAGRLGLSDVLSIPAEELSPSWSPIADAWPGQTTYSVLDLLTAAVANSDNTAADLLMKRIGGPGAVAAWLQSNKVDEVRVDRYEREVQPAVYGMASFRPAWKGDAAFSAARATVSPALRHTAMLAYMADPRDTSTPRGMLGFLRKLDERALLSEASTNQLLSIMSNSARISDRLKAGLPKDATFAHKPGTSGTDQGLNAAFNDVGIFTLADKRRYAIAAFLSGSTASEKDRADLFADLARLSVRSVG